MEETFQLDGEILSISLGGQVLETTREHPFYVAGAGWVRAGELREGDCLLGHDGRATRIDRIDLAPRFAAVYNLRVETDHTYFVGSEEWNFSVWVHNTYIVRQAADGTWEIFDDVSGEVVRRNLTSQTVADDLVANGFSPTAAEEGFSFGNHLKQLKGNPPEGMYDPHAHHILFKWGHGAFQQQLVAEGQAILRKVGIDPIYGLENLVWAPMRVARQHATESLLEVVEKLRVLDKMGAGYEEIVEALRELGEIAARRGT